MMANQNLLCAFQKLEMLFLDQYAAPKLKWIPQHKDATFDCMTWNSGAPWGLIITIFHSNSEP